ncbi:restriction endonuclease subunit S [Polaromonas sp.]|uniref:restriction endonuclease subunit S n=1 Tax=Polaromonas sp. TaxID=1869339 RepID=UPI001D732A30|nr:restriction endonuclease subunit S [Polaromonas sp.]MBT9477165.1 restriction endonuclease subunit S [Polaromonas sp.]
MSFSRYPTYKDSGVEWLGQVPGHWAVKRLKQACHVFPSNVDKKSHDGETPVLLCNYTDVYYNETITAGMEFMAATASTDQIAKFTLRAGDTIITKDSETADDIAIAAYVPADLPGVICGYHLSMVRPLPDADGAFIKRFFDSNFAKSCFAVLANGLTRVGLGQYALDNVELAFPPLAEQTQIAAFLDRETAKIDALVAEQRRLMALLKEKRQAVISHAVTRGLNFDAPLKPSCITGIEYVPAHWDVMVIKRFSTLHRGHDLTDSERTEGPYPVVTSSGINGTHGSFMAHGPGVVTGRYGSTGRLFYIQDDFWPHNTSLYVSNFHGNHPRFVWYSLQTVDFAAHSAKAAVPGIDRNDIHVLPVAVPPKEEQVAIVTFLDSELTKLDLLTTENQRAIHLLQERRTALISAAVTGQIDVRGVVTQAELESV